MISWIGLLVWLISLTCLKPQLIIQFTIILEYNISYICSCSQHCTVLVNSYLKTLIATCMNNTVCGYNGGLPCVRCILCYTICICLGVHCAHLESTVIHFGWCFHFHWYMCSHVNGLIDLNGWIRQTVWLVSLAWFKPQLPIQYIVLE